MKRLVIYLSVLISLLLMITSNTLASTNSLSNTVWKINKSNNYVIFLKDNDCLYTNDVDSFIIKASYSDTSCSYFKTKGTNKFYLKLGIDKYKIKVGKKKFWGKLESPYGSNRRSIKGERQNISYKLIKKIVKTDKTQIAETEPSQTQRVAKKSEITKKKKYRQIYC